MNMTKKLLASALAISFAAAGAAVQAAEVEGPKVEWRYSMWGNPRAFTAGLEFLAAQVKEKTGGGSRDDITRVDCRGMNCGGAPDLCFLV